MSKTIWLGLVLFLAGNASVAHAGSISFTQFDSEMGMGNIRTWIQFDGQLDRCLIDTGARGTVIKSHILSNAASLGKVPVGGISGDANIADLVRVNEMKVGDFAVNDLTIKRVGKLPVNCILGNDVLMRHSLLFDFNTKSVTTDQNFDGPSFALNNYSNMWFGFPVNIGAQEVDSLFDTGAALTLIDPELVKLRPDNFEFIQNMEITDGSDSKVQASIYKMKSIKFGRFEVRDFFVIAYSFARLQQEIPSVRVVLGFNVIRQYRWFLDNGNRSWAIIE